MNNVRSAHRCGFEPGHWENIRRTVSSVNGPIVTLAAADGGRINVLMDTPYPVTVAAGLRFIDAVVQAAHTLLIDEE